MRPTGDEAQVLADTRRAVAEITPDRPIVNVGTLEAHFRALMAERRNYVAALLAFALASTVLAVVGLYGLMAYDVHERAGEIAVRTALGARARDLVAAIGRPACLVICIGLATGLGGAMALTRLLGPQLWGVTAADPPTFAAVSVLLVCAALLGCAVPLRRALTIDPTAGLRSE